MSNTSRQTRRSSRPRLEIMESRALLSAVGHPAVPAADVSILAKKTTVHVLNSKGSLSGYAIQTSGSDLQGHESLNASGQGSSLGAITFSGQENFKATITSKVHKVSYTSGKGTLTAPGGEILVSFTGLGNPHTNPDRFALTLQGSVTGGTGKFAHATGSFSGQGGIIDSSPDNPTQGGTFSLSFTLKVTTRS
jgi:hypothetical protein